MAHRSSEVAKRMPTDRALLGVEVGVRTGKNAEHMLELMPNLTLYLVDTWAKPPAGDSYYNSGEGVADRPAGFFKKVYRETAQRTFRFGERAIMLKMTSKAAAERFRTFGKRFDLVFIDADHSYEGVTADLLQWWPLVAPGGYICGHDYNHPRIGEVKRAVDESFPNAELGQDMTWFMRKT